MDTAPGAALIRSNRLISLQLMHTPAKNAVTKRPVNERLALRQEEPRCLHISMHASHVDMSLK
jgi:hypothetical protein